MLDPPAVGLLPSTSLSYTCGHSFCHTSAFPSVLLRSWWITKSLPEAHWCALSVPQHPRSRLAMAWELLCSPSQALRISVWRPRRAECLIFIPWKAILYRRETGGLCYPQRVIQGCKFKHQVPLAYTWENGTLPSKQVHKYVPKLCSNITDLCPKRIKYHKHPWLWKTVVLCLLWILPSPLSVGSFFVTFPGAQHGVYAKSRVFSGTGFLKSIEKPTVPLWVESGGRGQFTHSDPNSTVRTGLSFSFPLQSSHWQGNLTFLPTVRPSSSHSMQKC